MHFASVSCQLPKEVFCIFWYQVVIRWVQYTWWCILVWCLNQIQILVLSSLKCAVWWMWTFCEWYEDRNMKLPSRARTVMPLTTDCIRNMTNTALSLLLSLILCQLCDCVFSSLGLDQSKTVEVRIVQLSPSTFCDICLIQKFWRIPPELGRQTMVGCGKQAIF